MYMYMYVYIIITSTSGAPPSLNWLAVELRGLVSILVSIMDSSSVPTRQSLQEAMAADRRFISTSSTF